MTDPWVAFVSARLADDEQHADEQHRRQCAGFGEPEILILDPGLCDCGEPARIRGWCATGRHILGLHQAYVKQGPPARMAVAALDQVMREMARNYRHHPDHPGDAT